MHRRLCAFLAVIALACTPRGASADYPPPPATPPNVVGEWTGVWGPFDAAKSALAEDKCKQLDCKVVEKDGVWQATFAGECGRPYKYTIKMDGRQGGAAVLFKGTTDLGEKDGGVYDWVGRANEKEFIGFYTSAHYVGMFKLTRTQATGRTE